MALQSLDPSNLLVLLPSAVLIWVLSVGVYRLYFHPLARLPGPKIAAVSYWYEFYYDMIKKPGGQYMYRLDELHAQYGPILRINPDEVQIKDAQFFDQVYASATNKTKRNRWPRATAANISPTSVASTVPHDLHRLRRGAISPYFSKAAIKRLEPRIQSQLALLCDRFGEFAQRGEVFEIGTAYTALSGDVITNYCAFSCLLPCC